MALSFSSDFLPFVVSARAPTTLNDCQSNIRIFAFDFVQVASPECSLEVKFDSYYRWVVNAAASLVVVLPLAFKVVYCVSSLEAV